MGRYKTLAGNTVIFGICNFTSKLLVFFMLPFYTAVLSTEEFGLADMLTTTVGLLSPFLTIEIAQAAMRFAMDKDKSDSQVFSIGCLIIVGGGIALFLLIPLIGRFLPLKGYESLFLLLYIFTVFDSFLSLFARGRELVKLVGIAAVSSSFAVVISNLLLLFVFKFGIEGYIISRIIAHGVSCLILVVGGKIWSYLSFKYDSSLFKEMVSYSIPLVPNQLSWWINQSSSRYFLNAYTSLGDVGLFSAASKIPTIVDTFRGIFVSAWQISMISEYDSRDADSFFTSIYKAYQVFLLVVTSVLIVLSKSLAHLLYSKEFFSAWTYAPILLIAVYFGSMVAFYSPIYLAHKKTNRLFFFTLVGAVITVVFSFILVPAFGVFGATISSVISYFSIYLSMAIDSQKYLVIATNQTPYIVSVVILVCQAALISFMNQPPLSIFSLTCSLLIIIINIRTIIHILSVLYCHIIRNKH